MIGYKAFDKDLKCRGFQFEVGKEYSTGKEKKELNLRSDTVFHFCREVYYLLVASNYVSSESRICEVVAKGDVVGDGLKFGTNEILILRELTQEEVAIHCKWSTCNLNTAVWNAGEGNTGDGNTGDQNTGDCNTGDCNTGARNTGFRNTGNRNTGARNTGDCNTGDRNTGDWNAGEGNTGDWNTGDYNTGAQNTGFRNTGDCNTGDWNTGDWNTGFFNTITPDLLIFNKKTQQKRDNIKFPLFLYFNTIVWVSHDTATDEEKRRHKKEIEVTGGFLKELEYKEAFRLAYDKASQEEHIQLFSLPNFDPAIFEEISGIDVTEEYTQWKRTTIKETKDEI